MTRERSSAPNGSSISRSSGWRTSALASAARSASPPAGLGPGPRAIGEPDLGEQLGSPPLGVPVGETEGDVVDHPVQGSRRESWKATEGRSGTRSSPSNCGSRRARIRSRVLLPEPDRPRSRTNSPVGSPGRCRAGCLGRRRRARALGRRPFAARARRSPASTRRHRRPPRRGRCPRPSCRPVPGPPPASARTRRGGPARHRRGAGSDAARPRDTPPAQAQPSWLHTRRDREHEGDDRAQHLLAVIAGGPWRPEMLSGPESVDSGPETL